MDKCEHCPVKFLPNQCYAQTTGHARFCEHATNEFNQGVSIYRRLVYERSTGIQDPPPETVPDPTPAQAPGPKPVNFRLHMDLLKLHAVSNCPAKGEKIGDGCNCRYKCSRNYGWFTPGEVSLEECTECINGRTPLYGKR